MPPDAKALWPAFGLRRVQAFAELAVFVTYVAMLLAGMAAHVMWRDEWQAWLIVRDSNGLGELFRNLRYEGHPALYYLLLYALKPVLGSARALQSFQAVAASTSIALLLRASPFTLAEKALLPFGAYTLYEYGIKSRSYVLAFLLTWLLCAVWRRPRRSPIAIGFVLALLVNVHVLFGILGCAAFAAMATRDIAERIRGTGGPRPPDWQNALGATLFGVGLAAAVFTALPPADAAYSGATLPFDAGRVAGGLTALGAFVGIVNPLAAIPGLIVLIAALLSLRGDREAFTFFALLGAATLLFFIVAYYPNVQHGGVLFGALIAAAWIARPPGAPSSGLARLGPRLLLPVLVVQSIVGLVLFRQSFERPYSSSLAVANYIRDAGWADEEIAATSDYKAVPVLGYLNAAAFFYVPGHRRGSFVVWDKQRVAEPGGLRPGDLPDSCPLVLIADADLPDAQESFFRLRRIARFDGALSDENYVLYRRACS